MANKWDINVQAVQESKIDKVDFDNLVFGKAFSDHMFVADFEDGVWGNPRIVPFQKMSFYPSAVMFHYGQTVFEGLKAYLSPEGNIRLFRPDQHAVRLQKSAERICMEQVPEDLFMEGLVELLKVDKQWIPTAKGCSLYIRPLLLATDDTLGVASSKKYSFIIMTSPTAGYYAGTVKVKVEEQFVRAAEGGTGSIKMGGNYAASLLPAKKAQATGYHQVLWMDGKEHKYIEESGTMNVMFQIGDKIVTPPLSSSILPGITRKSVLELAAKWGVEVEERPISIDEIVEAHAAGQLKDAFGTGTAVTVTHITHIGYKDNDYELPSTEERSFSNRVMKYLSDLKEGNEEDYMGWMVNI